MRTLPFNELLEILSDAWAIQFDDFLVFPTVNDFLVFPTVNDSDDEVPNFEIISPQEEWWVFSENCISDCHIDSNGDISFIADGITYTITVLERKKIA
jgi:hypothetical protein